MALEKTGNRVRESLEQVHAELTRRSFLKRTFQVGGVALFWDRFGEKIFGQNTASTTDPVKVFSAMGNVVIPIDQDPGYKTFDPGITDYSLNVVVRQVLLGGNDLLYQGILSTLIAFNDVPPMIKFGTMTFLQMPEQQQSDYFGNVLSGQFESYGVQDVIFLGAFVGLFASKATFFSNYPNHLAVPDSEFQTRQSSGVRTAWDIIGYRGPVGPEEEQQLRTRYKDIQVFPGMDPKNTYI